MSDNFEKKSSIAPILESYIEAPAAIKAGLGGLIGSLGVKGATSSNKAIRNSSIVAAPIAAYALGGVSGLAGSAAPIVLSNRGVAMPTLLAATMGQVADTAPILTDLTSASVGKAAPGLLGAAYLGKLTSEVPEITKSLKARKEIKAELLDPYTNPKILKEQLKDINLDLATRHILPGGSTIKKLILKRDKDKYIAKEMKEVAELLKNPGTNYKTSSFKKQAFGNFLRNAGNAVGKFIKSPTGAMAGVGGVVGGFAGAQDGGASGAFKGFVAGAAGGAALGAGVKNHGAIKSFGSTVKRMYSPGINQANTSVKNTVQKANQAVQTAGGGFGNVMGIAGGALSGGYAGYQASEGSDSPTQRAGLMLGGALGGAALGRGAARAGHMALGTNRGRALTQQAQMQGRTSMRQAFGGFRSGTNAELNTLRNQQAGRSNELIQANQQQMKANLTKDVGLGGYGLDAAQANTVNTQLNQATQYATNPNSGFIQRGIERFKNIRNMDYAASNQVSNYVVPGLVHGAVGAGAGYAADSSMGGSGYTGAILGGVAGAIGGGSRFNQQLGKTLTSRSRGVAEQYSKQLATSPDLQRRVLRQTGDTLATSNPALGTQLKGTVNTLEAAAPGSIKPKVNSLSVVDGNIKFTAGSGGKPGELNLADDIAQNLGAKNPDLVKTQLNNALPANDADKAILSNMLAKGGPEAEQLTNVLNAHSKEIVNISNQVHDDVANAIIAQGKRVDSASLYSKPLAGGSVDPSYLMSQPAMKDLANKISKGTQATAQEIADALANSGISAGAYTDDMANALKYQFDDMAIAAKNNLDKASTNMKNNLLGTQVNIMAKAHANEINKVTTALERAKTFADPNDLSLLQAHGNDLVELQMRQGPAGQRLATETLQEITKALESQDPNKIKALVTKLDSQATAAMSGSSAAGFQRATSGVASAAKNVFKGEFDDQFLNNAKAFVPPNSTQATTLENINMLDDVVKKQFMSGKINVDQADVDQLNQLANTIGGQSFSKAVASNTVLSAVIADANSAISAISTRIPASKITSALSGKGKFANSLKEIESILVSTGSIKPGTQLTTQQLEELINAKNVWAKSLEKNISKFKSDFAATAGSNPISSRGLNVKQLSGRTATTIDDTALQTAQRSATEAPVVAPTQAPVSLATNTAGFGMPTKALLGAGVLGGGYAGYNYLTAPVDNQQKQ